MKAKTDIKQFRLALTVVFIILSFVLLFPHIEDNKVLVRAKYLTPVRTLDENVERIDYLNEEGIITFAADAGYATMIATITENSRFEHFYDEKGEPVKRYSEYYGVLRENNNKGQIYHIQYFGIDDMPIITGYGYSDKYLTFYENGKIKTEKYYDPFGMQICTSLYGYGILNEYDDYDAIIRSTFLDKDEEPMLTEIGYAIVKRKLYQTDGPENGKIENEFYFDEEGKPIALSLGQFGVHKEYDENGQESVLTYLDQNGDPIVTSKGYTTVKRTYHADYSMETERYFDMEGKPFSFKEGQYGIKKENNQVIYLDKNGKEIFNIKRMLYNQTWIIIPSAILLVFISGLLDKSQNCIMLLLYIGVIIYFTLLYRENDDYKARGMLWQYCKVLTDAEARGEILKNIWLFIPFGAILTMMFPGKKAIIFSFTLSCLIEAVQYVGGIGFCELDDIISNTVGGIMGLSMICIKKSLSKYS